MTHFNLVTLEDALTSAAQDILIDTPFELNAAPIPAGSIRFGLHQMVLLFYTVAVGLITEPQPLETLYVTFKTSPLTVDVCFTRRQLILTPTLWQHMVNYLQDEECYDVLYDFDGSIEPLTWDEGYGQGVIVRLPWANQNEEHLSG